MKIFKDGDCVPASGVYAALHSTPHRLVERVAYLEGHRFQSCWLCPSGVLYRLDKQGVSTSFRGNLISQDAAVQHTGG
jgi:hypothetical protein